MEKEIKSGIIHLGDCREILKEIKSESVDLIVSDPPYKGISGGHVSKNLYQKGILKSGDGKVFSRNDIEISEYIDELYRILKMDSHCYIMTNFINIEKFLIEIRKSGFKIQSILVWDKMVTAIPTGWYMKNHDFIIFSHKGKAKMINNRNSKSVHRFENLIKNKIHPTEKPISLLKFYIENSSNIGDVVLDPFFGSGSLGVACEELGRKWIGIEIDEKYFKISVDRIENLMEFENCEDGY
ncbi:MAG: DNA-methyltransferase [Candidatus Hodarchaeales archaeon]